MKPDILRSMTNHMCKAALDTKLPEGFGLSVIVIGISPEGDFQFASNGVSVNVAIGILQRSMIALHEHANALSRKEASATTNPSEEPDPPVESKH